MTPFRTLLALAVAASGAGTALAGTDILVDDFSAGIHSQTGAPFGVTWRAQTIPVATDPSGLRIVALINGFFVDWEVDGTSFRLVPTSTGAAATLGYFGGGAIGSSGSGGPDPALLDPFDPTLDLSGNTQLDLFVSNTGSDAGVRGQVFVEVWDATLSVSDTSSVMDIPGLGTMSIDLTSLLTSDVDLSAVGGIKVAVFTGTTGGIPATLSLTSIRAVATGPSFPSFCDAADGSLASCPCANPGNPDSGCDIQQLTGGVKLDVVAQETSPSNGVTMTGTGFPAGSTPASIVIRAPSLEAVPVPFGDGLRCIGTPLVRLAATFAAGGSATHTFGHGAMAGSGDFHYQLWFRNTPAMYCTPDAFNLSNGRIATW